MIGVKTSRGGKILFRTTRRIIAPPDHNTVYAPVKYLYESRTLGDQLNLMFSWTNKLL